MLNKLVHETRGKCVHDAPYNPDYPDMVCMLCGESRKKTDYENDMNACMELWEDAGIVSLIRTPDAYLCTYLDHTKGFSRIGGSGETPQLAIIHAYLKSKGVELETTND